MSPINMELRYLKVKEPSHQSYSQKSEYMKMGGKCKTHSLIGKSRKRLKRHRIIPEPYLHERDLSH